MNVVVVRKPRGKGLRSRAAKQRKRALGGVPLAVRRMADQR